jgi:hypothetical protein
VVKLPNVDQAIAPAEKFIDYLLNELHREGRGKALFFQKFGFSSSEWSVLAHALIQHARMHDVVKLEQSKFGTRYVVEGTLMTPVEREPVVPVVCFVRSSETFPRLVTEYPLEDQA